MQIQLLEKRKPTRTISGVTPLTVVVKPLSCNWRCSYCPMFEGAPKSYTPLSPAIMRAAPLKFDPYKQVLSRLKAFDYMNHPTDKIELILIGGTFLDSGSCDIDYQYNFIKSCYDGLNGRKSQSLEEAKKTNETAEKRCVALCIETRPDVCEEDHINRMLEFGATRCELGVQAIDNEIYKKINRGHNVKAVIDATRRLKDSAFKVGYHVMPGLPGSSAEKDVEMYRELFDNPDFKPDQVKLYPTQVIEGTKLAEQAAKREFKTYDYDEMIEVMKEIKKLTPRYCRIMRVMREIPKDFMPERAERLDFRKVVGEELRKEGDKCKCIRCREVGFALREKKKVDHEIKLKKTEYNASSGKEIFLEYVNKDDIIFGLCRLRIPSKSFRKEIGDRTLLVRELHIYGPEVVLSEKEDVAWQHKGLGKKLMEKAEEIAQEFGCNKIAVISGIGVREYYRNLGYELEGAYMVKHFE